MAKFDATNLHRDPAALRGTRLLVNETPDWIARHKVRNAERQDGHPISLLLLDRQILADELSRYTRYVRRLETPQAVQEAGRIEFEFDPATQILIVHAISIFRDGELTNYANLDDIEVIQRERDLDKGIYAGSITALILLKDVRTGDIIDIESSIVSDNAIFPKHNWFLENFEHTLPVAQQHFSWLSHEQERFQINNTSKEAILLEEETEWGLRKTWSRNHAEAIELPALLPIGLNPFQHIALSSFKDWQEVASTVAQLWECKTEPGEKLPRELAKLRDSPDQSPEALIEKIVTFVRDNIRYQGVEVGSLGLIPEDLKTIWERRFGDCKEKTSLLCWLLRECGFKATPALVSTALQGRVSDQLPAPVFDHVVVHLRHNETDYWVDPTVISQRGSLSLWITLPFEKALLISRDTTDFLEISPPPLRTDFLEVEEHYDFNGNDATLTVTHHYHGAEADGVRHGLDSSGRSAAQQYFTEFVKSTRSKAELTSDLEISDNPTNNKLTLRGVFNAPETLSPGNQGPSHFCEFIPHSIAGKITGLDDTPRTLPLGLLHPVEIYHSTKISHPDAKGSIVAKTLIDNEFITFKAGSRNEKTNPEIFYEYRSKSSEIPPNQLHRYRLNLKQISQVISLIFESRGVGRKTRGSRLPEPSRDNTRTMSWEEEELSGSRPVRRSRQHSNHQPSGSSIPIWPIAIVIVIIVKVVLTVARSGP